MEQELRMKREAAKRAFESQAEKDRTLMRLEELRFLGTSIKDLDDVDAYWIKKQKRLIRNKMKNDLGAEDDEDKDEDDGVLIVVDIQEVIGNTLAIKIWSNGVVPIRAAMSKAHNSMNENNKWKTQYEHTRRRRKNIRSIQAKTIDYDVPWYPTIHAPNGRYGDGDGNETCSNEPTIELLDSGVLTIPLFTILHKLDRHLLPFLRPQTRADLLDALLGVVDGRQSSKSSWVLIRLLESGNDNRRKLKRLPYAA
nr:hypothetical protein [Tanacetum cinerariifolium]